MVNSVKISQNMEEYGRYVLEQLERELRELKQRSVAHYVDKKLSEKLR